MAEGGAAVRGLRVGAVRSPRVVSGDDLGCYRLGELPDLRVHFLGDVLPVNESAVGVFLGDFVASRNALAGISLVAGGPPCLAGFLGCLAGAWPVHWRRCDTGFCNGIRRSVNSGRGRYVVHRLRKNTSAISVKHPLVTLRGNLGEVWCFWGSVRLCLYEPEITSFQLISRGPM